MITRIINEIVRAAFLHRMANEIGVFFLFLKDIVLSSSFLHLRLHFIKRSSSSVALGARRATMIFRSYENVVHVTHALKLIKTRKER